MIIFIFLGNQMVKSVKSSSRSTEALPAATSVASTSATTFIPNHKVVVVWLLAWVACQLKNVKQLPQQGKDVENTRNTNHLDSDPWSILDQCITGACCLLLPTLPWHLSQDTVKDWIAAAFMRHLPWEITLINDLYWTIDCIDLQ